MNSQSFSAGNFSRCLSCAVHELFCYYLSTLFLQINILDSLSILDKKNIILSVKQEGPFIPYYSLMHPAARFLIKPFYHEDGSQIYLTCGKVPAVYGRKGLCKKITSDVYEMLCKAQSNISGTFYLQRVSLLWSTV